MTEKPTYTVETVYAVANCLAERLLKDPENIPNGTSGLFSTREMAVDYKKNELENPEDFRVAPLTVLVHVQQPPRKYLAVFPIGPMGVYPPMEVYTDYQSGPTRRAREQWEAARAKLTDEEFEALRRGPQG